MNNITIHGRLTRDPELREFKNKKGEEWLKCTFTVAVDRKFGEETDFFNCIAFGRLSEVINKFLLKGSEIVVSGEMQCNPYEGKDGTKRYPWNLVVQNCDFCGSKKDKSGTATSTDDVPEGFEAVDDENIPF